MKRERDKEAKLAYAELQSSSCSLEDWGLELVSMKRSLALSEFLLLQDQQRNARERKKKETKIGHSQDQLDVEKLESEYEERLKCIGEQEEALKKENVIHQTSFSNFLRLVSGKRDILNRKRDTYSEEVSKSAKVLIDEAVEAKNQTRCKLEAELEDIDQKLQNELTSFQNSKKTFLENREANMTTLLVSREEAQIARLESLHASTIEDIGKTFSEWKRKSDMQLEMVETELQQVDKVLKRKKKAFDARMQNMAELERKSKHMQDALSRKLKNSGELMEDAQTIKQKISQLQHNLKVEMRLCVKQTKRLEPSNQTHLETLREISRIRVEVEAHERRFQRVKSANDDLRCTMQKLEKMAREDMRMLQDREVEINTTLIDTHEEMKVRQEAVDKLTEIAIPYKSTVLEQAAKLEAWQIQLRESEKRMMLKESEVKAKECKLLKYHQPFDGNQYS
mmetsp:Transcript_2370/g.4548  ORF Transcript_2370/g.4548 Transcript_2370/m.4548 type:complete len:452 (-) Transcript_2370:243-1598(-)